MVYKRFMKFSSGLVCALLIGASAPAAYAQRDKAELEVGTVVPLTGRMAFFGKDLVHGMTLAVEAIKSYDQDLGDRIDIVAKDNEAKAGPTALVTKELVDARQADVLVGAVSTITTEALISEAERYEKSLVAPAASDDRLSKRDGVFRTCMSDSSMGRLMAQFAIETLKQRRAVILYDADSNYSASIGKAFVTEFTQRGGRVLETLSYRSGDGSFRAQLTSIKQRQPGVILVPGFYEEVGRIMRQAVELGISIPMLGADGWDSPNLIRIAGKRAILGHYFITHFSSEDPDEKVQAFVNAYRRRYGNLPSLTSAMGYDAMMVLADAFKRARTNLPDPLQRALSTTERVEGLMGPIHISKSKEVLKPAVVLSTTGSGWRFHSRVIPDSIPANQGG